MAKSAVTSYSSLLKEIASELTEQDVADIKLLLRYPAATKISTGTQLLVEMERQADLDEDNLETLKDVLGKQKLKRLVKIVEKFEKASSNTSQDQLTKSWPSAALKEKQQQRPKDDRLSQSATSAGIQDQLHASAQQRQQVLQQNVQGAAPPESCHGSLPQEYLQPSVVPAAYMDPSMYQQGPQSQHQQQNSPFPGNVPTAMSYEQLQQMMQLQLQQQWQELQQKQQQQLQQQQQQKQQQPQIMNQQQQFQTPSSQLYLQMNPQHAQYPVTGDQSYTGSQYQQSPGNDLYTYIQRVKSFPTSTPPGRSGHAKVVPSKSCPSQYQIAPQELAQVSEEEAGLKPVQSNAQTTKEMNIPAENMDAVVKTTGEKTVNGNIVMGTSSMAGRSSPSGLASPIVGGNLISVNGRGQGTMPFQTGRMRANSGEQNNESIGEGVHPMSQQMRETNADLLLLSGFSSKKLYDCRKVDFIPNRSYQVRIQQGVHYITSEGAFAIVPFNSAYTIELRNNNNRLRCSALVVNNGNFAGDWTIDPNRSITIERPVTDGQKFHFMEASRAPSGSGVRVDDPNNGVICVTFTPEKDEALNDLSRGFGHLGITSNGDYFENDDMNDVQRSIAPQPDRERQVGCTVLHGDSHQRFTRSEYFQLDNTKKTTIVLKLIGKST